MPMGFSFQPGADQLMGGANGQGGRSVSAPDSSVKVLSFRMPKRDAASAIAPQSLLQAAGGGAAGLGGLSPQILALLMSAFSAGPRGLTGPPQGPFDGGSSDPAGVVGPSRPLTPRFTIGDGGRLPMDLGPAFAAGGPGGGERPPMGGFPAGPPTSSVSPGPRYKFDAGGLTSEGHPYGNDALELLGHRYNPDTFR